MSTEVAVPQQGNGISLVPTAPEQITSAIEQWVGGMAAAIRGAEYIVDTPLCPDSYWPLPAGVKAWQLPDKNPKQQLPDEPREAYLARRQVAAYTAGGVVRYGLGLGLSPEVALTGIFMIGGRMSMYADQMVALIKSHGHGHQVIERTRTRAVVRVKRRGEPEWQEFTFAIEDAIGAGYVPGKGPNAGTDKYGKEKRGGNEKYLTLPANMLEARASTDACTAVFPDVLRGLTTREAMEDEIASRPVDITASVNVSGPTADRPTAAAILAASQPAEQQDAPAEPASAPAPVERAILPVTDAQLRKLGALFTQLGVKGAGERANRLAVASQIAGRPLESSKDLTLDEARILIDTLEGNGIAVIAEVLGWEIPGEPAEVAGPGDGYDPTTEQGWPMDGAEAAAEGGQG